MSSGPTTHPDPGDGDPSLAVLEAVAEAEGIEPSELDSALYRAVDPVALDALFDDRAGSTGRVVFHYHGYEVTVTGDGRVTLEALD